MLSQGPDCKEGSLDSVRASTPFCLLVKSELSCDSTLQLNELNELVLSYEAVRFTHRRQEEGPESSREDEQGRRRAIRMWLWLINRMHCGVMRARLVLDNT